MILFSSIDIVLCRLMIFIELTMLDKILQMRSELLRIFIVFIPLLRRRDHRVGIEMLFNCD